VAARTLEEVLSKLYVVLDRKRPVRLQDGNLIGGGHRGRSCGTSPTLARPRSVQYEYGNIMLSADVDMTVDSPPFPESPNATRVCTAAVAEGTPVADEICSPNIE
jgi:hypothetical protein